MLQKEVEHKCSIEPEEGEGKPRYIERQEAIQRILECEAIIGFDTPATTVDFVERIIKRVPSVDDPDYIQCRDNPEYIECQETIERIQVIDIILGFETPREAVDTCIRIIKQMPIMGKDK